MPPDELPREGRGENSHDRLDRARAETLITAAGLTVAVLLLLGVGFTLQLYRRRRLQILRQIPSGWSAVVGRGSGAQGGQQLVEVAAMNMLHARAAAIEALPSRAVTASEVAQAAVEAVECSICLADLAVGDTLTRLPCGHEFHGRCIRKWLWAALDATCPLCKTALVPSLPPVSTSTSARASTTSTAATTSTTTRASTTAAPVSTTTTTPDAAATDAADAATVAADAATVAVAVGSLAAQV